MRNAGPALPARGSAGLALLQFAGGRIAFERAAPRASTAPRALYGTAFTIVRSLMSPLPLNANPDLPAAVEAVEAKTIPSTGLQLHLGSGPHAEPGWVNVDKSLVARISRVRPLVHSLALLGVLDDRQRDTRWPREVVQRDLTKQFEWKDHTVRAIYSSHMVEHLDRAEARHLLEECLRVLKPGGVLRLALPNLLGAVERYQQSKASGNHCAADELIEFLYFVPSYGTMSRLRRLGVRMLHRSHAWMYDADSMNALLKDIGFTDVRECRFHEGACPDLGTLETRRDETFEASTFFIEGVKA